MPSSSDDGGSSSIFASLKSYAAENPPPADYDADRDANEQFHGIFAEIRRKEEAAEPSLKQIPRFFFKKAAASPLQEKVRECMRMDGSCLVLLGDQEQEMEGEELPADLFGCGAYGL